MNGFDVQEYLDACGGTMTPEEALEYRRSLTDEDCDRCECEPGARVGKLVAIVDVRGHYGPPPGASITFYNAKAVKE